MSLYKNNELSDNANFAVVLATLVSDRCKTEKSKATLRTGLQASVPVSERPYVRRGVDALIDHGLLAASGENLALTRIGQLLLDFATRTMPANATDQTNLHQLLQALDTESRLQPARPMNDIMTLPGRLEGYRERRRAVAARRWPVMLWVLLVVLSAAALFYLRQ